MKKILISLLLFFMVFINVNAEGFVTNIKIDGNNLEGFSVDKFDYQLTVDGSKNTINISYVYDATIYIGSGNIGDINLKYGDNNLSFTLKSREDYNISQTYNIKITRPDNRSGDNSLASLTVGSNQVVLTEENEYNVSVDSKLTSVEVHATPSASASLVDGYGERLGDNSLKLSGEKTSFEIKVKAENDNIRTYKINVVKTNYQSNDATLKQLTIENVDFAFKNTTYEYDISVKHDISKLKINAVANNEKAKVEYQENVTLQNGINNFDIKVTAEDGTVKIYKLNVTREEEVPIVKDIKITGVDFEFNPKTYNYKIETTLSKLDFNVTLNSETAKSEIINNEELKNNSVVKIKVTDGDKNITYNFKIINKTAKEEVKEEKKEIKEKNDFFKENEMVIGLVIFGIGVFSTLVAVVLKKKVK